MIIFQLLDYKFQAPPQSWYEEDWPQHGKKVQRKSWNMISTKHYELHKLPHWVYVFCKDWVPCRCLQHFGWRPVSNGFSTQVEERDVATRDVYHFMAGLQKVPKKLVSDINVWTIYAPRHLQKMETKRRKQNAFFSLAFPVISNHWPFLPSASFSCRDMFIAWVCWGH